MITQQVLDSRKKELPSIDDLTTILWTSEIGKRMALVRMKMLKDQTEISREFKMNQPSYSKLERGAIRVTEKVTVADLKRVYGSAFSFIVFGTSPERYNSGVITRKYWDTRLRERRKNKSPYSKSRIL